MDVKYLKYTEKEFNQIIKYYIGTPKIYKYCYEHSPEFKEFIDNSNDEFKKAIKKMHLGHSGLAVRDTLVHISTMGLSLIGQSRAEKKEFAKLDEIIKSDEFKTLFKNFYEVRANMIKK